MVNKKMISSARNLDTIVKVVGRIFEVMCIVLLVFVVLVVLLGESMYEKGSVTLDLDFVTFYLADSFQQITGELRLYTVVGLIAASVMCVAVSVAARVLRRILAPMKEGRPFETTVSSDIRKIGWIVMVSGALWQVFTHVLAALLIRAFPVEQIFDTPAITRIEYQFTLDFGFVLVSCVLFFLSYIFSYGQVLQQESDETL